MKVALTAPRLLGVGEFEPSVPGRGTWVSKVRAAVIRLSALREKILADVDPKIDRWSAPVVAKTPPCRLKSRLYIRLVDAVAAGIDRESPLPYYHQLKQLIVADIAARGLQSGDRFPGDHELCQRYEVSRTVVRQALTELEYEGVIERVKGRGTFVAGRKTPEGLVQSLTGLFEDVRARGGHLRSEVRRRERVPADDQVAQDLEIQVGDPVIEIERLRFVDGEPWALNVTQLPATIGEPFLKEDLADTSLYSLLEDKYGVRIISGRRSIEAAVANKAIAAALQVRPGSPVLVLRSVSRGETGAPVERFVAFHRGDRSRFEVELQRGQRGSARPLMVTKP